MTIKTVLLVDDEKDIRRIGELSLSHVGGFEVLLAREGTEALELARAKQPDLILLDVMMPGMDGTTVFQELRKIEALGAVPIIFMTAKVQASELKLYDELGANGVIQKPFDPMTLPDQIHALLHEVD